MSARTRWFRLALVSLATIAGLVLERSVAARLAEPRQQGQTEAKAKSGAKDKAGIDRTKAPTGVAARPSGRRSAMAALFNQPGDDPPQPATPLRPATVDDRRRLEAIRLFTAARALEDRGNWTEAASLLQDALKLDPESVAIARRLSKIYSGALARPDLALQYGRRVLAIDPEDSATLSKLVEFYSRRGETEAAEKVILEVLANPKLPNRSPGRLMADFELGQLYSTRLKRLDKAADAFARVIDELDDRSANRLSPNEMNRILGNDPEGAYLNFGLIFLAVRRDDLAVKAFEHGLVYDEDHNNPQLAIQLAETLLRLKKPDQALELVESSIKLQPQGLEAYDLMARVLKALGREAEITPRLEDAARRDSKNVPLQYVLADRYRETGQVDKAEALYKALLSSQPTPQTYRALATSLFKRKKLGELLKLFCDAFPRENARGAILPLMQSVAQDDELTDAMLDAGIERLSAKPPTLPPIAFKLLGAIAAASNRESAGRTQRLERLLKLQRLDYEQGPSPLTLREIADTQRRLNHYAEAASTVEEMFRRFPEEKTVTTLSFLAEFQHRAGQIEAARKTLAEAMKLDPNDPDAQTRLADALAENGQFDDAEKIMRNLARREPNNPMHDVTLGLLLTRFGRNEAAIQVFQDLLKHHGDNPELVKQVRNFLSITYVNMGNYAKGEAELEILLQQNPDEAQPNNDLGYLYADQGKHLEKAELMIQKALRAEPNNAAYLDSMGWVLYKRGKLKEALENMKKAADRMLVERAAPDSTILEHLGDVYFQLRQIDHAEDSWRKALKAAEEAIPPDKRAGEIKRKLESLRQSPKVRTTGSPSP